MQSGKSFGETIRDLRIEKQLTLREVAKYLKIDTSMLGKIEKNNRKPTKQFIKDISNLFNINEDVLTVAHLSDTVAYTILEEELANEVLKVAEEKINYHNKTKVNK
ncbi:Transcriptional regulator [Tenacibaculum maritimum]|uniref:helix-turn-helix domain-containing protein n=1 Tax=Tenacibaculum maritimum TaxID=107401 RepID=UPI0012E5005A|nr:helix-turn-helix transcriptional regulator [Tenacibaculum maritimum]CAA0217602.1 Transcriptional regulator [Tenacibaculum maritimum]